MCHQHSVLQSRTPHNIDNFLIERICPMLSLPDLEAVEGKTRFKSIRHFSCAACIQDVGGLQNVSSEDEECVFRDDTIVLLEMTTRDMMEAWL